MATRRIYKRVLAIDPFSRGVGFAVLEGPEQLIDWGLKTTKRASNEKSARAIKALIDIFKPDVLAIEAWTSEGFRRCARIQKLLNRVASGQWNRIKVRLVTRRELSKLGPYSQTNTKYARAELMAARFPELAPFMPRFRKPWMSEDCNINIFDAVTFAVVCFPNEKEPLSLPSPT